MAVLRYKVVEILKEFDGEICEVRGELVSVHKNYFTGTQDFIAEIDLKIGQEFQQTSIIKIKYATN